MRAKQRIVTRSGAIIAWRGTYVRWCVYAPGASTFRVSTETYAEAIAYAGMMA